MPVLEQTGIVLAIENVRPGPATDLVRLSLAELDTPSFGFCYDSAHDQIDGPRPFTLLDELGHRLKAVHLSDRVREFVDHVPPGDGWIDWVALTAAIRATPFAGPLLFEVMVLHSTEKDPERLLRLVHERGSALYNQIFADGDASSEEPEAHEFATHMT
jgi:sugar phosphate isomerase/epimerase